MTDTPTAMHLDDSEILHLVDGDASAFELDRWTKHVLDCSACTARLERLQRRSAALSVRLAEVQPPEGFVYPTLPAGAAVRRRPGPGRWAPGAARARAAALALLVLAPLVFVAPLRAWVTDRVSTAWEWAAALAGGEAPGEAAPEPEPAGSARLWFTPAGATLRIDFASPQRGGELLLRATEGPEGSLEILRGAGETPVVTEGEVRILNTAASDATYLLSLPPSLRRVQVRVAGEEVASLTTDQIRGGARVELGTPE